MKQIKILSGFILTFLVGAAIGAISLAKSPTVQALMKTDTRSLASAETDLQEQCISDEIEDGTPLFVSCAGFLE